ncbi:hypothetical protein [Pseudomonas bohemica]|uniref:hypothetical protein n=1 Tax=Pseudomonas bohemica TaxID=2044872 RepID=UPI000DA6110E|nr:hypothetical protein [Pseudomonas bohemica]
MISLNLSTVQERQVESGRLAAAMADFLRRGGQVSELPGPRSAPRPYRYRTAPAPVESPDRKPVPARRSKKETVQRLRIVPDIEEAQAKTVKTAPLVDPDQIRDMAKIMTQGEVAKATGVSRKKLYTLAKAHGFEFQESATNPAENLVHNTSNVIEDAKNVVRIKALRDIGVSRNQAAKHMGISTCYLRRLIRDYAIDFPAMPRELRNIKASA